MKKGRQTTDYLNDILYAISKLDDFIQGLTYEQFMEDEKTQFAVVSGTGFTPMDWLI